MAHCSLPPAQLLHKAFAFGTDTNLYRSAVNTLRTDSDLQVSNNFTARLAGATQVVIGAVTGGGATVAGVYFGSAQDTNLYRSAADTLATDDTFNLASGALQTLGTNRLTNSGNLLNIGSYSGSSTISTSQSGCNCS